MTDEVILQEHVHVSTIDIAEPASGDMADAVHHDRGTAPGEGKKTFEKYLKATIQYGASDLIVKVDLPPRIRVDLSTLTAMVDVSALYTASCGYEAPGFRPINWVLTGPEAGQTLTPMLVWRWP